MADIVSVTQTKFGTWMMTLNGSLLGDSRPHPTKEAAVAYAQKIAGNWSNTELRF